MVALMNLHIRLGRVRVVRILSSENDVRTRMRRHHGRYGTYRSVLADFRTLPERTIIRGS